MTASIAVVGPGAIGTTVAAALHEVGRTPALYGRRSRDELILVDGDRSVRVPGPVRTDPSTVDGPADLVFLAVKTTQVKGAANLLRALVGGDTVVCALQNGVEQESGVRAVVKGGLILPSVVWFPAQAEANGSVTLRGESSLSLPDEPGASAVVDALEGTRFRVEVVADFTTLAWRKLLQNAMAGLMALTGRRAGMFTRGDIAEVALVYMAECLQVARAEGAQLGDEVPAEILARFQAFPADMGTSILTDRVAERRLEWDVRNGVVQRRGRLHHIATPLSDLIVPLLAASSDGPG